MDSREDGEDVEWQPGEEENQEAEEQDPACPPRPGDKLPGGGNGGRLGDFLP